MTALETWLKAKKEQLDIASDLENRFIGDEQFEQLTKIREGLVKQAKLDVAVIEKLKEALEFYAQDTFLFCDQVLFVSSEKRDMDDGLLASQALAIDPEKL